jgi:hypothetical protein
MKSPKQFVRGGFYHLLDLVCFYFFQFFGFAEFGNSEKNIEADVNNIYQLINRNHYDHNDIINNNYFKTSFIITIDSSKMFDFKMCLLDLIRIQMQPKPRKSLKEISSRYSDDYLKKYNDINVIHFNENMSMVNKMNNIRFAPCPRNFQLTQPKQIPGTMGFGGTTRNKSLREWGVETVSFDFSSDDRQTPSTFTAATSTPISSSSSSHLNDSSDEGNADLSDALGFDSFCTLCTSSFSFNNCNCEKSICGSKCSSSTGTTKINTIVAKRCECPASELLRDQILTKNHKINA